MTLPTTTFTLLHPPLLPFSFEHRNEMLPRTCLLLLLILLSSAQQWRLIARAPLPAQDAVEFVTVAQQIERDGIAETICAQPVAPAFPIVLYLTHTVLVGLGLLTATDWACAAQVAAAWPTVLAVVPIYLGAARLVGREGALLAGTIFCMLPATARLGVDGISDSLHLCLAAWSVWAIIVACERHTAHSQGNVAWWTTAGIACGFAILCRAESLVIAAAIVTYASMSLRSRWRGALAFASGSAVCVATYLACGIVDPQSIAARIRGGGAAVETTALNDTASIKTTHDDNTPNAALTGPDGEPLVLGRKDRSRTLRLFGFAAMSREFLHRLLQGGAYCLAPLAALGFWSLGGSAKHPAFRLLTLIVALHLAIAYFFALRQGYVTTRHFLLPIALTLPYAAAGLLALAARLPTRFASQYSARLATGALGVACLLVTLSSFHRTHSAHRRAADWLQSSAADDGAVLDQQGWTALYTGRPTYRFDAAETALIDPRLAYVIVERADLEAESRRGESLRALLGDATAAAMCFADERGRARQDVLLFQRSSNHSKNFHLTARRETMHAR